jgi:hypothetical protein
MLELLVNSRLIFHFKQFCLNFVLFQKNCCLRLRGERLSVAINIERQ